MLTWAERVPWGPRNSNQEVSPRQALCSAQPYQHQGFSPHWVIFGTSCFHDIEWQNFPSPSEEHNWSLKTQILQPVHHVLVCISPRLLHSHSTPNRPCSFLVDAHGAGGWGWGCVPPVATVSPGVPSGKGLCGGQEGVGFNVQCWPSVLQPDLPKDASTSFDHYKTHAFSHNF